MAKHPLPLEFEKELMPAGAKSAMTAANAKAGDRWMVPIENLRVMEGFNVRITDAQDYKDGIKNLAALIKENGFKPTKPLAGFAAKEEGETVIYVTDGHRRLEAAKMAIENGAEIAALPVVLAPPGTSMEDLTADLYVSNTGSALKPIELAIVVGRLLKFGQDEKQVARRLDLSTRYIADLMLLLGSNASIRKMVIDGKVSATEAIKTLKDHGAEAVSILKGAAAVAESEGKKRVTGKIVKKEAAARAERAPRKVDTAYFLVGAINYALEHAIDGLEWLKGWRDGDPAALEELETHLGQPIGATNNKKLRIPPPDGAAQAEEDPDEGL